MKMKFTKNTLARFQERIGGQNLDNFADTLADNISIRGEELAHQKYNVDSVDIYTEKTGDGQRKLIASGKGIAYLEFGTGLVGEGTYPDNTKLPKQSITFTSPKNSKSSKDVHTTQGWEYYYPNKKTKFMGGWFIGKAFTRGQPAQAQMFYTAQQLKKEVPKIVKQTRKGDKK